MYKLLLVLLLLPLNLTAQLTEKNKELLRQELAQRINDLRISKGLEPLIFNDTLKKAAEFHSEYMSKSGVLSHDENKAKYATPKKRVRAFKGRDFEIVGENVLYSSPQNFPIKKNGIVKLAEEMFQSWKKSPGHYANMTEPEYVYGDLGFKSNLTKNTIYATQVFGTKGYVVDNQISPNAFGIMPASPDCEDAYERFSNIVLNMGNDFEIEGDEVYFYYHDRHYFNKIFSGPRDGIAIDLVSEDQLLCGRPNQLDFSPIFDGILLKPTYKDEMIANNKAESDYRIITKVGDIPPGINGADYSPSVVLIKDGKACKYLYPAFVPRNDYELRPIEPITEDQTGIELTEEGVVLSQTVNYDFKTNITSSIKSPEINVYSAPIHSIHIQSFSSVEGDSVNNSRLHTSRADYIRSHLHSKLNFKDSVATIEAEENWKLMNFQLNYFERDDLAVLSHDSLKQYLIERDDSLPWDSLLLAQRTSTATIHYAGNYAERDTMETKEAFNLRTAVATNNIGLANKALYEMYETQQYNPEILFEPSIQRFFHAHPETVTNYSAMLSHHYTYDIHQVTRYMHNWLGRSQELSKSSRSNMLHLYTLVGSHLLDNWDVSAERLSNVIHPHKIEPWSSQNIQEALILNLHLTFIQYFGQINDGKNISKSFYFIGDYFKEHALDKEDDVDLALYFNNWSMYKMTEDYLLSKYRTNDLNEDGLFILAQTMNFMHSTEESGEYLDIHQKALNTNKERWCLWLQKDFQVKRNHAVKRLYCDFCE